ncbi:hypothetical protein [Ilumatobacter nonamiensis]|uniref:hypothetical protein n=1 Tax=Ilumatobacter nonamiensis TaxID=467093 RepID=UPI00034B6DB1|nr:hypothetical protein [Ilumatobacter nonamiensis]
MTPGSLIVGLDDRTSRIEMIGGGQWTVPVGPVGLVENELERANRPAPEQLTNALGVVTDHLDDVIRESPLVLAAPAIAFVGPHAIALAHVELGATSIPPGYELERSDADEVFRTLVAEPRDERLHNPGLDPTHVDTIVGTCCVVLAVMRRLDLSAVAIMSEAGIA